MTAKNIIIENSEGKALRHIRWGGERLYIVERKDRKRLEFYTNLETLNKNKIKYQLMGELSNLDILETPYKLPRNCQVRAVTEETNVINDIQTEKDEKETKYFYILLVLMFLFSVLGLYALRFAPAPTASIQEELKQQLVKIVKPPEVVEKKSINANQNVEPQKPVKRKVTLKRMGALAALGSLNSSKQRGGLNLGAINTTAGIGLGGTQGSGGVQTSLYGKGIVSAPLGTGGNIKGAGGYGTKGAGGGQAGYGQLSLIGSAGTNAIPLGREAIVGGGLDPDAIAEVVRRNQGQIMFCYEQGLQSDAKLSGRVAVKWTIGAQGQVKSAEIQSTSLNAKSVEDCIVMRLKTWKFPLPQGGVDVSVSYPFLLKRAGQG